MTKHGMFLTLLISLLLGACGAPELPEKYGQVDGRLYLGQGNNQPLIVGLGGSEGGNAWDSDRWKNHRDRFIEDGYAFLALEYFGGPTTPAQLDRISLEGVHDAIVKAAKNSKVNPNKIALIGGSKGAELALLLASLYPDIGCVIAIVPGHAAFPALTLAAGTSSWTYRQQEVPFVPMPWTAVPAVLKQDLRSAFEIMIEDDAAVANAVIHVEEIQGSVLFLSATADEMWPSTEMSAAMMNRLADNNFGYTFEHIAVEGGHLEPLKHFDRIFDFLDRTFKSDL